MNCLRKVLLTTAVILAAAFPLPAQLDTVSITGFVSDPAGAMAPGVQVTAVNEATGLKRTTVSSEQGSYVLTALPPGTYTIEIETAGFKKYVRSGFGPLTVGQTARANITLELGSLSESVQVAGEAPLVEAENATVGAIVDQARIQALPLNSRNPFLLLRLAPNVNFVENAFLDTSGFAINSASVNGSQSGSTAFFMDGGALNVLQENEVPVMPNVEMVEEFRVHTNSQSAEFGMNGGGAINVVTKSGTNHWHGSAYDFLRNDALDANSWANNRVGRQKNVLRFNQFGASLGGPVTLPKIYRGVNRTFFFGNYEGVRLRSTETQFTRVPLDLERQGDFSRTYIQDPRTRQPILAGLFDPATTRQNPAGAGYVRGPFAGNRIPASRMDRVSLKALGFVPAANRPPDDITGTNNLVAQSPKPTDIDQFMIRIDHQITDNNRIFGRYLDTDRVATSVTPTFALDNPADPTAAVSSSHNRQFVLGDTHTFTPTLLNEFRFSLTREYLLSRTSAYMQDFPKQIGLPAGYPGLMSPRLNISDVNAIGGDVSKLANRAQVLGGITNTVTKVWGRHNIKTGLDLRVSLDNNYQPGAIAGTFAFGRDLSGDPQNPSPTGFGLATFLLGTVSNGSLNVGIAKADGFRYYAGFIQDDFKATPRLTLNLGFRYEYIGAPTERFSRYSNFNAARRNSVTGRLGAVGFAGVDFGRSVLSADGNDFSPRFGFAYDLLGNNKLIVRGGYGIFYYQPGGTLILGPYMGYSTTSVYTALGPFPSFQFRDGVPFITQPAGPAGGDKTFLGSNVDAYETHNPTPYVQQWNAGVQYALPAQNVIEVTYAGNHGVKQPAGAYDLNQLPPEYLRLGFALDEQVANPFASIGVFGSTISRSQSLLPYPAYRTVSTGAPHYGNSNYHSVLVRWEKRWSNGLSYLVSFTGSKMIGDVGRRFSGWLSGGLDTACGQNAAYERQSCRSIEPIDVSRRLVASAVYELPFGQGKPVLAQGLPAALAGGWQLNGILELRGGTPLIIRGANNRAADRPDYLRSAKLENPSPDLWFDTAAFAQPAMFTFGNGPRTLPDVRGPGYKSLDFSLFRNVRLAEGARLQIRAEAFNLLNAVNLGLPGTSFTAGSFARITGSRDARIVQFGLKVLW